MPYCTVASCKNHSGAVNMKKKGISYHNFPKDPKIREKWINATGRKNWMPTKCSTICSSHFLEEDFDGTKKVRKLLRNVYPTVDVWKNDAKATRAQVPNAKEVYEHLVNSDTNTSLSDNETDPNFDADDIAEPTSQKYKIEVQGPSRKPTDRVDQDMNTSEPSKIRIKTNNDCDSLTSDRISEVSRSNEFDEFGKSVGAQLKSMPLDDALELLYEIQQLITTKRWRRMWLNTATQRPDTGIATQPQGSQSVDPLIEVLIVKTEPSDE